MINPFKKKPTNEEVFELLIVLINAERWEFLDYTEEKELAKKYGGHNVTRTNNFFHYLHKSFEAHEFSEQLKRHKEDEQRKKERATVSKDIIDEVINDD